MDSKSMTKSNFGSKGWRIIIMTGFLYFFFAGTVNDGLNIIVRNYSQLHGLDYNAILALGTPASWFGILGVVVWTVITAKIGSRLTGAIALALGGISYGLYGVFSTSTGFFITTALINFMAYGFCNTAAQVMIANWFPIKKGLALGWSTMGTNLSSAVFVPLLTLFIGFSGINGSYMTMGVVMLVAAVIFFALTRSTPEEMNYAPDNGSTSPQLLEANRREMAEYQSPWTLGKLLKLRETWLVGIAYGAFIMVTVALISQLIPRLMEGGWSQARSTTMMTVASVFGLAGSYVTGWIDQKIGTKKASILYGLWYLVALIFCAVPANDVTMYLSVFFLGVGLGGIGNLFPSMLSSLFNRFDFVKALGVTNVICLVLRSFTFSIMAFGLSRFGGYAGAYAIFIGIDIVGIILLVFIRERRLEAKQTVSSI